MSSEPPIEYWHWHTLPYGTETYWGGVLPHSLVPGRVYHELAGVGAALAAIGGALDGYEPDADVAILWSTDSRFAFEFAPPLAHADGTPDRAAYTRIFDAFHAGVIDAGAQARVLHTGQARELGAAELAARHPVLVAPALYVATDDDLDLLREYAAAGGHLVVGIRTGYADEEARARVAVAPDRLHEAAGVRYEEFSNLQHDIAVDGDIVTTDAATATRWADGLLADGAEVLVRYRHPRFSVFPAVTTHPHGAGRITVVGTVPSPALAADVVRWLVPEPLAASLVETAPVGVTISSGTRANGGRAWFVFQWSGDAAVITLARPASDLVTGASYPAGSQISLGAWSVTTLVEG